MYDLYTVEMRRKIFKTLITRPLCLLDSITPYGGYKGYELNHMGQKYQFSLYDCQILRRQYFEIETVLYL